MTLAPPIAPDLFVLTDDGPRLIGGRCLKTGRLMFPKPAGNDTAAVLLSPRGTLWSWTVQRFLPKSPPYAGAETAETFRPYAVGYVELPGEIIVESRIVGIEPEALAIGLPLKLILVPFATCAGDVTSFAFAPTP